MNRKMSGWLRHVSLSIAIVSALALTACGNATDSAMTTAEELPYEQIALRIASRLAITDGERILIGHDPQHLPELVVATQAALTRMGAITSLHVYGADDDFFGRLQKSDIYIWMPFGADMDVPALLREFPVAAKWVMEGTHRQLHFHWDDGTRAIDGMQGDHSREFDAIYVAALDIDYDALHRSMRRAATAMRAGEIHVTTPAGTDIRFRIDDRPINIQSGDASLAATRDARLTIQREIELPAGALRVAPIEASVNGVVVVPYARLLANPWARSDEPPPVRNLRLRFTAGKLIEMTAEQGADLFQSYLDANSALDNFREFALGFNPKLTQPEGSEWLPYYGYGAGVVRLSIGNNEELGGAVRGDGFRWFLFPDATVTLADGHVLVRDGVLQKPRQLIELAESLQVDALMSSEYRRPIIVFVSQPGCEYCHLLREQVLHPMIEAGILEGKSILREVSLDDGFVLIDFEGRKVSGREFAQRYGAFVTPTLLFLDSDGQEVSDPLVGISNIEYYGVYLDRAIDTATTEIAKRVRESRAL